MVLVEWTAYHEVPALPHDGATIATEEVETMNRTRAEQTNPVSTPTLPAAMPISRVLRGALGAAMLAMLVQPLHEGSWSGRFFFGGVVFGLAVLYTLIHLAIGRVAPRLHPWAGAFLAVAPVVGVFSLGGTYAAGAVGYIGLSLLVQALRGDPGCEVMALPGLMLRRTTHLVCILFTPLDWIEGKLRGARRGSRVPRTDRELDSARPEREGPA